MGKYLYPNQVKRNIPIRVAAVLFCLTVFSTYLVTGLFARYSTSAQSSDQARVAAFSIQGAGALQRTITADIVPGESKVVKLIIDNSSEVSVEYMIEISNETQNLPLSFCVVKQNETPSTWDENGTTFKDQQIPGNHTDSYDLHILWQPGAGDVARIGMVDYMTVKVTAVQID